jgi:hypothetical protein
VRGGDRGDRGQEDSGGSEGVASKHLTFEPLRSEEQAQFLRELPLHAEELACAVAARSFLGTAEGVRRGQSLRSTGGRAEGVSL